MNITLKLKKTEGNRVKYYEREIEAEDLELAIIRFVREEDEEPSAILEGMYMQGAVDILS